MECPVKEYVKVLEEESKKHGWGCLLVIPEQFAEFLATTRPKIHLDVGCHKMLLKDFVKKVCGAEYIGLDIWHYGTKIHILASGDLIPLRSDSVDTISFIESLEHIPDYVRALREAYRVARVGIFVQSVICTDPCALADRTHYHVLHPVTLARLARIVGFRKIKHGIVKGTFWLWALKPTSDSADDVG